MNRFGFLRDPLFKVAAVAYVLNRFWLAPSVSSPFLRGHFNDLLLIPAALPVVLWLQRRTGLRPHDHPPTQSELWLHLLVWSFICEFVGPFWLHRGTADWWDLAAYALGGMAACRWWHRSAQSTPSATCAP